MMAIGKFPLWKRSHKKDRKNRDNTIGLSLLFFLTVQLTLSASGYGFSEGFYLEVPYVQQVKNYCGPAVLAMVFRYWDHSADQHDIASKFVPFPKKGLSGDQLKQFATESGFSAYSFSGDRDNLIEHLRQGRPLIVALASSFPAFTNHYVVVVGWIASSEEWIVHDPSQKSYQRRSAEQFEAQWNKLENWSLLILPEAVE